MLLTSLRIAREEFESGTGWELKPEGACKGNTCVPLAQKPGEILEVTQLADELNMPLVGETELGLWALGPESIGSRALSTAIAPDLILPDLDNNLFKLSSLKGQKIIVYAWAPY